MTLTAILQSAASRARPGQRVQIENGEHILKPCEDTFTCILNVIQPALIIWDGSGPRVVVA